MSNIEIDEISTISMKLGDKLLVRLPEYSSPSSIREARESLASFLGVSPERIFVYTGDVSFSKVGYGK